MDIPLQSIGNIRLGKVVIEQIILISNKKIPKDAMKYLQVDQKKTTINVFWQSDVEVCISDSPPQSSKSSNNRDFFWADPSSVF